MYIKVSSFYCQPNPRKEAAPYAVGDVMHSLDYREEEFKAYCHFIRKGNLCSKKIELGFRNGENECTMVNTCNFPLLPFPEQ